MKKLNTNFGNPVLFLDKKIHHMQNLMILIRSSQAVSVSRSDKMVNFLSAFIGLSGFLKTSQDSKIKIDNLGFKLHYRFTAGFLFLSTAFCGMSEIFGKNIQCQFNKVKVPPGFG